MYVVVVCCPLFLSLRVRARAEATLSRVDSYGLVVAIYVPHLGYRWYLFRSVFEELSHLLSEAQEQHMHTIVAGDFNLDLGDSMRGDAMR